MDDLGGKLTIFAKHPCRSVFGAVNGHHGESSHKKRHPLASRVQTTAKGPRSESIESEWEPFVGKGWTRPLQICESWVEHGASCGFLEKIGMKNQQWIKSATTWMFLWHPNLVPGITASTCDFRNHKFCSLTTTRGLTSMLHVDNELAVQAFEIKKRLICMYKESTSRWGVPRVGVPQNNCFIIPWPFSLFEQYYFRVSITNPESRGLDKGYYPGECPLLAIIILYNFDIILVMPTPSNNIQ